MENVTFKVNIEGNARQVSVEIDENFKRLAKDVSSTQNTMSKFATIATGVNQAYNLVSSVIGKVSSAMTACNQAYAKQSEAEAKLGQVMRNTIGASQEEIKRIQDLTAAHQKLGVIGDEVQLAGAQELATYVSQTDTLEKLIPVLNDMTAQQYGLNATQESAQSIATMLGKVMDGQVNALSRYGYKFNEAQEQLLKFGTEEQRVATLAEVVGASVGGVNQALAQTPAGQWQQIQNRIGDIRESLGRLFVTLQGSFAPMLSNLLSFVEKAIANIPMYIDNVINAVRNFMPIISGVTAGIAAYTLVVNGARIASMVAAQATQIWTAAQAILNAVMTANPIGLIIAGVAALIGVIIYLKNHITGLGTLWKGVWDFCKNIFQLFVDTQKYKFDLMVNGIMIGLDKIKEGWYRFKSAVGLGDESENRAALDKIQADVEARQKAIADGAKKIAEEAKHLADPLKGVKLGWDSGKKTTTTQDALMQSVNAPMGGGLSSPSASNAEMDSSISGVVTGGAKDTTINITLNDLVGTVNFAGGLEQDGANMTDELISRLAQVLNMAKTSIA